MNYKILATIGLIIITAIVMFFIGFNSGYTSFEHDNCNHDLYKYQCDSSPTLDYEFNCHTKFTNITGVYCIENETYVLKCANELK